MDPLIAIYFSVDNETGPSTSTTSGSSEVMEYFTPLKGDVSPERCEKLVSESGHRLGDYDFFFEWFREPSLEELNSLIQRIDDTLKPLGVRYMITSKK